MPTHADTVSITQAKELRDTAEQNILKIVRKFEAEAAVSVTGIQCITEHPISDRSCKVISTLLQVDI